MKGSTISPSFRKRSKPLSKWAAVLALRSCFQSHQYANFSHISLRSNEENKKALTLDEKEIVFEKTHMHCSMTAQKNTQLKRYILYVQQQCI